MHSRLDVLDELTERIHKGALDDLMVIWSRVPENDKAEFIQSLMDSAITMNKTEVLKWTISEGADPSFVSAGGITPLHSAALHMGVESCSILLSHGADRNRMEESGATPMHLAALHVGRERGPDLCRLLMGENLLMKDGYGRTPEEVAAQTVETCQLQSTLPDFLKALRSSLEEREVFEKCAEPSERKQSRRQRI